MTYQKRKFKGVSPEGVLEELLLDRVIFGFWRLRYPGKIGTDSFLIHKSGCLIGYECMNLFGRYEIATEIILYRAFHELQRIMASRMGVRLLDPVMKGGGLGSIPKILPCDASRFNGKGVIRIEASE